ncbi:MAG: hypothetical protein ACK4YQ_09810 [Phenylobacterium sp.]|uniref:hypothetical protein n=1 Tax=Phenylobacterium sp. TaxID=1871053 RepID=UPI00391D6E4F
MSSKKPPSPEIEDREVLDAGQEEVFSRTEIERGGTEHSTVAGHHQPRSGPEETPKREAPKDAP